MVYWQILQRWVTGLSVWSVISADDLRLFDNYLQMFDNLEYAFWSDLYLF